MPGLACCSNPPILDPFYGVGHVENLGGLDVYLTGSLLSTIAILFVSDIYGYQAPIIRNLADRFAAAEYYVVVPDYFNDHPFDPKNLNKPLPIWRKEHPPEKGFKASQPLIEALKSKDISAIGAAGFCWGAKTVCELGKSNLSQVITIAHPSSIKVDDIDGMNFQCLNYFKICILYSSG